PHVQRSATVVEVDTERVLRPEEGVSVALARGVVLVARQRVVGEELVALGESPLNPNRELVVIAAAEACSLIVAEEGNRRIDRRKRDQDGAAKLVIMVHHHVARPKGGGESSCSKVDGMNVHIIC